VAIYALGEVAPRIDPHAFVHPAATVIGDVTLGPEATVWPSAVLRGDYGTIVVGARSSIQDGSVLHAIPTLPTTVGEECVVGHLVHLEGCTLEDGCLVGSHAVVLHNAVIGSKATVGAGAVVTGGTHVPPGALAVGVPAVVRPDRSHVDAIRIAAANYVSNGSRYRAELRRLD
jgi:carbonic anhydrase/acetyltransferase-like protein (isoleucine patch superfamily)